MLQIRKIKSNEYRLLNEIEDASDALFLGEGIDFSSVDSLSDLDYQKLDKSDDSVILVALLEFTLVGFCFLRTVDSNGFIAQLCVHPSYIRQKIGSSLIDSAVVWSVENNFEFLLLTTFEFVPFNAPMYEKIGFKKFNPDSGFPELKMIRENEKRNGLELASRTAMRKKLR